jgi:hypothetical protein
LDKALGHAAIVLGIRAEREPHDPIASALIADPASYALLSDGTPILWTYEKYDAKFAWAAGVPTRVSSS